MKRLGSIVVALICLALSLPVAAQQVVFIVRHADKADESDNSPLSDAGKRRAEALARLLKEAGVTAIYTSKYTRTVQTAGPLARQLKLPIREEFVTSAAAFAGLLAKQHAGQRVLVVGHSNTVPELLYALGHPKSAKIQIGPNEYDNLFMVVPKPGARPTVVRLRYGE